MPWRETIDPYAILVSEIMLQQTQVERVRCKYTEFMSAFPDSATLAAAPLDQVLRIWQGLGYNRRAIALQRCAQTIETDFLGIFPLDISQLESLPGIGPYTARAMAAFAFGVAEPLIETNIRTVFIHFFFHEREGVTDREIMPLVAATLDRKNPREWYYALMDYGVHLKGLHPNPGRRSRHHQRQSRFEGSNRQLRSRILKTVLEYGKITRTQLSDLSGISEDLACALADDLCREGFLEKNQLSYRVSNETKKG